MKTLSSHSGEIDCLAAAFAVSTSVSADILLMDEWLSAGDAAFSVKARVRLSSLVGCCGSKSTVVIRPQTRLFNTPRDA